MQSSHADTVSRRQRADIRPRGRATVSGFLFAVLFALPLSACSQNPAEIAPKDFPSADVPLISGSSPTFNRYGAMWDVSIAADRDDGLQPALQALLDKGFQVIGKSDPATDDLMTYSLASSSYSVRLGYRKTNDDFFVTYGIAKRSSSSNESSCS